MAQKAPALRPRQARHDDWGAQFCAALNDVAAGNVWRRNGHGYAAVSDTARAPTSRR